jgi:hypothetical protein
LRGQTAPPVGLLSKLWLLNRFFFFFLSTMSFNSVPWFLIFLQLGIITFQPSWDEMSSEFCNDRLQIGFYNQSRILHSNYTCLCNIKSVELYLTLFKIQPNAITMVSDGVVKLDFQGKKWKLALQYF